MLTGGQKAVSGTVAVCLVPPGPGVLALMPIAGGSVFVGFGSGVSTSNGFPVPSGGITLPLQSAGGGGSLYATVSSGTVSLSWIVSAASSQTGF